MSGRPFITLSLDLVVITLQTSAGEQVRTCMGLRNNHAASTGVRTQRLQVYADAVNTTEDTQGRDTRSPRLNTRCLVVVACKLSVCTAAHSGKVHDAAMQASLPHRPQMLRNSIMYRHDRQRSLTSR